MLREEQPLKVPQISDKANNIAQILFIRFTIFLHRHVYHAQSLTKYRRGRYFLLTFFHYRGKM